MKIVGLSGLGLVMPVSRTTERGVALLPAHPDHRGGSGSASTALAAPLHDAGRLYRRLVEELDRLANEDAVDRSQMARRLLDEGLAARRMRPAVEAYRAGRITPWRAARIAGVSPYEMLDLIHEEGIPHALEP